MAMAVAAPMVPLAVVGIRSVYCEEETGRFYRVVYTGLGQQFTYLCNLDGSRLDIRAHTTDEFRRIAAPGYKGEDRLVRCDDPYDPSRMLVSDTLAHKRQSKVNWKRIRSIATEYLPDGSQLLLKVLNRSTKRRYLSEYAQKAGVKPPVLYKLLRLYLQRGMTPSAVASGYANCGRLVTNALYNAANDESGILKNEPIERNYKKRPGRPARRSKYRYALPSAMLNRLMWQYLDMYTTWKEGPWFLDPDAKELGEKLLGKRRGKMNRFKPRRSAAVKACMRPRGTKEAKGRRSKPSQRDVVDGINFELRAQQVKWDEHGHIVELKLSDDNVVTERAFNYFWSRTRPSYRKRRRKHPAEELIRRVEPERGRAWQHVKGPGDQFLIDSTIVDVYLISRYNRRLVIGRPTLYFIVDLWSCMIVGLHLTFDPPSKIGAALALDNMLTPKAEFCKRYGFDITVAQWPCCHAPSAFGADRGSDFLNDGWDEVCDVLQVQISHPPPYAPTWRGCAERRFGIVPRGFQKSLGGVVEKDVRLRTDRDFPWDGRHTLAGLMLMLLRAIHTYHRTPISGRQPPPEGMVNKKLANTPLNRWNWGVENRSGWLREASRDAVKQALWPTAKAKLNEKGITWEGAFYKSPNIEEEFWRTEAKKKTGKGGKCRERSVTVDIRYDPSLMDQISFISYGYQETCELHPALNDHDLHGVSLAEWKAFQTADNQNKEDALREGQVDRIMQAHNTRVDDAIAKLAQKAAGAVISGSSTKKAAHPDTKDMKARRRVARKHEAKFSERFLGRRSPSTVTRPPRNHAPTRTATPSSSENDVGRSVSDAARSLLG